MPDNHYRIEYVPLAEIQRWPRNPKAHDEEGLDESLERFGFVAPLLLDEKTGKLVAGHGRLEALQRRKEAGKPPPSRVAAAKGGREWLVPVVRGVSFENEREAEAYLLADNKLSELGGWDEDAVGDILRDLQASPAGLEGTGFDVGDVPEVRVEEVSEALAPAAAVKVEKVAEEAEPEPAPDLEVRVQPGDVWALGPHRVMCGDSTREEDVEKLLASAAREGVDAVVTDPPYAIYGSSTGIGADISDDKMVRPFFEAVFKLCRRVLPEFGVAYVCTDWRSWAAMWEAAKRAGMTPKNCIVWDKGGGGLGANWANAYELCGYFAKLPPQKAMTSNNRRGQRTVFKSNLQRFPRPRGDEREHNAAKPVGLMEEFVDASTEAGAFVLEPFCGSGTTLIACERRGRSCLALDLEPKWVQVTINRWERLTGKRAEKLP